MAAKKSGAKPKIGFIGIGLMGHGAARNLADKGFPLAFLAHRNRAPAEDLLKRGAREVKGAAELAGSCDVVILCLPSSREVEALVLGAGGIIEEAHADLTVIDMTTADPASTRRIAAALKARGVDFVDSPLGRNPKDAQAGKLNAMVGAAPEVLAKVRPVLEAFCENIFHCGPVGAGHTVKLINNFIGLGTAAVAAEGLVAAARAGLDLAKVRDVVVAGGANSAMFQGLTRSIVDGDATAGQFALSNAAKDVRYFVNWSGAEPAVQPVAAAVLNAYNLALGLGRGGEYLPKLVDALAGLNGVKLARKG